MNDSTAALEVSPKSLWPISGSVERSSPTIAPTNALTATSSENCARFSRSPSSTGRSAHRARRAAGRCGWRRRSRPGAPAPAGCPRAAPRRTPPRSRSAARGCGGARSRWSRPGWPTGRGRRPSRSSARGRAARWSGSVSSRSVSERYSAPRHLLDGVLAVGVQVRPAGVADEQRVAGQHEPRLVAARAVGDEVGVMRERVPGRRDRLRARCCRARRPRRRRADGARSRRRRPRAGTRSRRCARRARAARRRGRPARASRTPRRSARPAPRRARCSRRRGRRAGRRRRTACCVLQPSR